MLDASTFYLLLAMAGFVLLAVVLVHHHNSSYLIRKKERELTGLTNQLTPRITGLERDLVDLKIELDEVQADIDTLRT